MCRIVLRNLLKIQQHGYFQFNLTPFHFISLSYQVQKNNINLMKKDHDSDDQQEDDEFEVETKFPQPGQPVKIPHHHFPPMHPTGKFAGGKDFSPLPWEDYFDELFYLDKGTSVFKAGQQGAIFFCIHGAGHSALSFATLAQQVKQFGTVIAYDFKGHGYSKETQNLNDMSIQSLTKQALHVLDQIVERYPDHNIIMVGHSLGGAVAIRTTEKALQKAWRERVQGIIVIDVVEGTALEALPFMSAVLENRPKGFKTINSAIEWSVLSQTLRKLDSARVSIPPQLKQFEQGDKKYTWKVDLKATEQYWQGWFKGLSKLFLDIKLPKLLITAEKERLDNELIVAQMQGKFKLSVIHHVGHSVQQDDPKATAKLLHEFVYIFRIPQNKADEQKKIQIGIAKFHPQMKNYH